MRRVLEEYTGIIGVGCLVSLGIFFLTDSMYDYWRTIEELTRTNSWGILIPIPFIILNYITGLIITEVGDILIPRYFIPKTHQQFVCNFLKISKPNMAIFAMKYSEIEQNSKILNGSCIGFICVAIGILFEGIHLSSEFHILGLIGMIGSFAIATLCPFVSFRMLRRFNSIISQYEA